MQRALDALRRGETPRRICCRSPSCAQLVGFDAYDAERLRYAESHGSRRRTPVKIQAIVVSETGGPEVLQLEERELADPGPGQVRIRTRACGVNYIDVYFRTGLYPRPLPFVAGLEGAGEVEAVGARRRRPGGGRSRRVVVACRARTRAACSRPPRASCACPTASTTRSRPRRCSRA